MLDRKYDPATLDDLAALVASARKTVGNTWQIAGIRAALVKAANRQGSISLARLSRVALTVASDRTAQTPERIAQDGPWWNPETINSSDVLPRIDFATACHDCLELATHPIHDSDHKYVDPRRLQPVDHASHAAEIRAAWASGEPCQAPDCGLPREHLVHGNTGREHDHEFVAPPAHQPTHRPEGTRT